MMSREEEGGEKVVGVEVEVNVDESSLVIPPDDLRCQYDECKNWRLHEKKPCQLHYFEQLKKKNQSKGVKRNRGEVEKLVKNDGKKKKGKKNDKGLKEKSDLDDNGGVDENGEKRNGNKIVNEEESEKMEVIVPVKKNGGGRNEVALMEKCDLDVNNGVSGDDLVMKKDLDSKLVQKRTEIRRSTRSMTVAGKNGDIITEKKSDEGELDHGEDDKSGKSNLEVSREEKKDAMTEILVQKNEKKKKKQPSRNKGVETKKDHLEVEELMHVEDDKKSAVQEREEDKQVKKMEILSLKEDGNITEKKIGEGELVEDDNGAKSNLLENKKDEKMESPIKKNEKKKKKQPSRKKGVEVKKDHLEVEELMKVEDDKKRAERNLWEMGEDKQDKKMEIPVMKEDEDITEKKIDKGELVEDDKGVKSNLQGNKDEKMEVPMKKNEKKQKKKVKKDKMAVVKRNDVDEGQLLQVDDANKGDEKNLHEREEDKKKEIDIPVKKNKKKNKSDKQEEEKKNDLGEEGILQVENDKGSERNLHEREEGKKVKKNDKKRKGEKNIGEEEKKTNFDGGELLQVEDEKGTKRNLQELEDKKDEKIDIPVKKCKRNKGENKKNQGKAENKQVLESSNMPNDSSELMKVEGKSGSVSDKQKKESQQESVEGKIEGPVKKNAKKKNKGIIVNKQDSETVNMRNDSLEPMKVEGKSGMESEDKNCNFAGSSHKLVGASTGHVLKGKGEPLVETKGELRHNTRSTVGGANVISEDGEQRRIVQALQAMPTGGAKNDKVSKETGSVKVAKQNLKESKKVKKVELPVKKTNEAKGNLAKDLVDGATKVVKNSSIEKQVTVSNVEDESLEDFEEAKVDFAGNVAGKEKKMKGCVSKSNDETVVKDKQTLEPKIELRRSKRTTTGSSC